MKVGSQWSVHTQPNIAFFNAQTKAKIALIESGVPLSIHPQADIEYSYL